MGVFCIRAGFWCFVEKNVCRRGFRGGGGGPAPAPPFGGELTLERSHAASALDSKGGDFVVANFRPPFPKSCIRP